MSRLFFRGISFALLSASICFGVGCESPAKDTYVLSPVRINEVRSLEVTRKQLAPGIEVVSTDMSTSTPGSILMFGFDQKNYAFRFASTNTRLTIREWKNALPEAVAAINGVYFMEDLTPAGLFIGKGAKQAQRLFDADKSALIFIKENALEILDTSGNKVDASSIKEGAQTYPILIKNGKGLLTRDTGKEARRSWIGYDETGRIWLGVLPNGEASLFELMKRLMKVGIKWNILANLDGGPSTGMFVEGETGDVVKETIGGIPNILLVERK